jgi:hypothetical protein
MKKLIAAIFAVTFASVSFAAPEVKEVCIDKVVNGQVVKGKDGKPVQVCKKVKVHKKLDGTPVPPKK